jgi:sortase A
VILGAAAVAAVALAAPASHHQAGAAIATVQIPRIGVNATLYEGTTASVLSRGPGHYRGTGLPGQGRTIGIAAHRTTHTKPFARLNQLRSGDRITISSKKKKPAIYRVYRMAIVRPTQVSVLRPTKFEQVVLTACHPPKSDRFRLVVFAKRVEQGR